METVTLKNIDFVWDAVKKCFRLSAKILERTALGYVLVNEKRKIVCGGSFDVLPGKAQYYIHQLCDKHLDDGPYFILLTQEGEVRFQVPFTT